MTKRRVSFGINKLPEGSIQIYIDREFGRCPPIEHRVTNEASTDSNMKFEFNMNGESGEVRAPVSIMFGQVDAAMGRLLSLKSSFELWGGASQWLLSGYALVIQSGGLYTANYLPYIVMYDSAMRKCGWRDGAQEALNNFFTTAAVVPIDDTYHRRFSVPLGVLPYAGLAATIFLHGMALFAVMGRLLLSNISSFDTERCPFSVVAMIGSLIVLAVCCAIWLLLFAGARSQVEL